MQLFVTPQSKAARAEMVDELKDRLDHLYAYTRSGVADHLIPPVATKTRTVTKMREVPQSVTAQVIVISIFVKEERIFTYEGGQYISRVRSGERRGTFEGVGSLVHFYEITDPNTIIALTRLQYVPMVTEEYTETEEYTD